MPTKRKIGKDIQEIERGKCACGECDDFILWLLWLLWLFFHSKKDDGSSSDSVSRHQEDSTSDAGTSGRVACEQAFGRAGWGEGKAKRPVDKHLGPPFYGTRCASDPDAGSY